MDEAAVPIEEEEVVGGGMVPGGVEEVDGVGGAKRVALQYGCSGGS